MTVAGVSRGDERKKKKKERQKEQRRMKKDLISAVIGMGFLCRGDNRSFGGKRAFLAAY